MRYIKLAITDHHTVNVQRMETNIITIEAVVHLIGAEVVAEVRQNDVEVGVEVHQIEDETVVGVLKIVEEVEVEAHLLIAVGIEVAVHQIEDRDHLNTLQRADRLTTYHQVVKKRKEDSRKSQRNDGSLVRILSYWNSGRKKVI